MVTHYTVSSTRPFQTELPMEILAFSSGLPNINSFLLLEQSRWDSYQLLTSGGVIQYGQKWGNSDNVVTYSTYYLSHFCCYPVNLVCSNGLRWACDILYPLLQLATVQCNWSEHSLLWNIPLVQLNWDTNIIPNISFILQLIYDQLSSYAHAKPLFLTWLVCSLTTALVLVQ